MHSNSHLRLIDNCPPCSIRISFLSLSKDRAPWIKNHFQLSVYLWLHAAVLQSALSLFASFCSQKLPAQHLQVVSSMRKSGLMINQTPDITRQTSCPLNVGCGILFLFFKFPPTLSPNLNCLVHRGQYIKPP